MATIRVKDVFSSIKSEGTLMPIDLLQRIAKNDASIGFMSASSYDLVEGERINEAIGRSWNRMTALWSSFSTKIQMLPDNDLGTTITRNNFLLPLFQELGYGKLELNPHALELEGKEYPISHIYKNVLIHLISFRGDIDKRDEKITGAKKSSPHSMIQELLNREDKYLWAFVSNGKKLRVLRDNSSYSRQSYLEFDLEVMMSERNYYDFSILWLICHASRFSNDDPKQFIIEKWISTAKEEGTRALDDLRVSVEKAISSFGSGFIACINNFELREKLKNGSLNKDDYYRQLLRIVYRLIFLFVSEDRDLLLLPEAASTARQKYYNYYSTKIIRDDINKRRKTKHLDLWRTHLLVSKLLSSKEGFKDLGLPALGSFLWSSNATPDLTNCDIENFYYLDAIQALCFTEKENVKRKIDWRNMGAEELGSVYESLLELNPNIDTANSTFELKLLSGSERKTTGSYYTPSPLINCLLDSALESVLEDAMKSADKEKAILNLKVCDPACGSGHFLVSAAHRIAKKLAYVRTGEEESAPSVVRHALRDVISRCIYGVDINPMAVELCKVSLWLEAIEPGKPLSFLDHHIKCGNSLLGATPKLLKDGIPDEAFTPIEGDDKEFCRKLKKANKIANEAQLEFRATDGSTFYSVGNLAQTLADLNVEEDTINDVENKQKHYNEVISSSAYKNTKLYADAFCYAFMCEKKEGSSYITQREFKELEANPAYVSENIKMDIINTANEYNFFHFYLEFPEVFHLPPSTGTPDSEYCGWNGGFDVILANPPWERVKLQEKEFFANKSDAIANARNANERERLIKELKTISPALHKEFLDAKRIAEGESHFIRNSMKYPLCGRGDVNTYTIFAELFYKTISLKGKTGIIVPTGIATDDTTKFFFQNIIESRSLVSLYDFENSKGIFESVHRSFKFCLLTLTGLSNPNINGSDFLFFAYSMDDLGNDNKHFTLTAEEISLINPNTRTCPIFRTKRDAEITKDIYKRIPVLINENNKENGNPWAISFNRMFDMSNDSHLFKTKEQLEYDGYRLDGNVFIKGQDKCLPLYEGKMFWIYDHRFGTYKDISPEERFKNNVAAALVDDAVKIDNSLLSIPKYWIPEQNVIAAGGSLSSCVIAFRDVSNSRSERTAIFDVIPHLGVGNNAPLLITSKNKSGILANLSSFIFDYICRQSVGGNHLNFFVVKQLPVLPHESYSSMEHVIGKMVLSDWIKPKIIELCYTAHDMKPFAQELGYNGEPFKWDEERRFKLRCEIDALFFYLYSIKRDDVDYIMDTFLIVKCKDEEKYGEYRTKKVILEIYDKMASGQYE